MAIDKEFLTAQLQGVEGADEKITAIIAEYEKEKLPILKNRDDIKAEKTAIEKKFADLTASFAELETAKKELNDKLESGLPDKEKKIFQDEIDKLTIRVKALADENTKAKSEHENEIKKLSDEKTRYIIGEEFSKLINENKSIFPELRNGLVKRFFAEYPIHDFEPNDSLGKTVYANKEGRKMSDLLNDLLGTDEGKHYVENKNNGGGSPGSSGVSAKTNTMTRDNYEKLSPQEKMDFTNKGGSIA